MAQFAANDQESVKQKPSAETGGDAEDAKALFDAALWGKHNGHPDTYRRICAYPTDREYADLCQQWRTAEATVSTAYWAKLQFFAGIAGIAGLLLSLFYTAQTLRHAEETARRQLRAYLLADKFYFLNHADGNLGVEVAFKNTGQTPAKRVEHVVRCAIGTLPSTSPFEIVGDARKSGDIGPGQTVRGGFKQRHGNDFLAALDVITARTHTLYVHGWIKYFDVFEEMQTTKFRYRWSADSNEFVSCDEGNEST